MALAVGVLALAGAAGIVHARSSWRDSAMRLGFGDEADGMHHRFGRPKSKDAFEADARSRFARLDKNSDGVLDTSEIEAAFTARMADRHGRGARPEIMLHRLGAGADAKLTRDEFRNEIGRRFAEADLNNDGRIDDADLPPMMRGRNAMSNLGSAPSPRRMGSGGQFGWLRMLGVAAKDGAISRDDVMAAADRQFDRLDRNKDGVVDQADFDALHKDMLAYAVQRFIHSYGADKDGRITREQFMAKAGERFARLDVNGDGTISRDEMPGGGRRHGGWMHGDRSDHGPGMGAMRHRPGMGMAQPPPGPDGPPVPEQKK
ncbi:MAG: hypothetical protein JSS20_15080 [Proteobacteria bacterium]|nr:hypothetical protein [Pseudomonadota bacterium]